MMDVNITALVLMHHVVIMFVGHYAPNSPISLKDASLSNPVDSVVPSHSVPEERQEQEPEPEPELEL